MAERKGIEDALYIGNLTPQDLQYERMPFHPPFLSRSIETAIARPLEGADLIMSFHERARRDEALLGLEDVRFGVVSSRPTLPPSLPAALRGPVGDLVGAIAAANADVQKALSRLSAAERRMLIESLPQWANEEPSIRFDFVRQPQLPQAHILRLLERVDPEAIRLAGIRLTMTARQAARALENVKVTIPTPLRFTASQVRVVIGSTGDDVHTDSSAMLTIDLGGNDRYRGRHGAGIGYSSVLIDVAGDDDYRVPDASIGAGLLGVGIALDLKGDDRYRGRSLNFGCGIAGVGVLVDDAGHDTYQSVSLGQAYGQFGQGILLDESGSDTYRINLNGQGAARTGGLGWLIDRAGNDVYRAGGLIMNSPLFKDVHYSNAQGFASGYREDTGGLAGGIGLLTDLKGDDAYIAETYAQAASYWYSIGSLFDGEGHDTYTGYHYVQGSAMHVTASYLFDLAGDDAYVVKYGAAHAIGHDYGVGFLLDRSGNDIYAGRDSRPGIGNANGLGIFIDGAGEDRYHGPPGAANPGRGSGSLGLFVDLNGPDTYTAGLADGEAAYRDSWALALDMETDLPAPPPPTSSSPQFPVGSKPRPSDRELEDLYRKATQWGVGTAQQEVQDSLATLAAIGIPALEWMVEHKLRAATRLHQRAFVRMAQDIGKPARDLLAQKIASPDVDEARLALNIAVETAMAEAAQYIPAALAREALKRQAARAAGVVGSRESVSQLMTLTLDED
ncbi:MAG TPA: hypothetical protein VM328_06740, partial [Fimbriimonadaceae bacterium]|nr:hypothetical protein [Fimbriimonadaceae bacterium]